MKKQLKLAATIILFSVITAKVSAQTEWFPFGAKWYYGARESWSDYDKYYITFEVIGDDFLCSMLYSKTCRELVRKAYNNNNELESSKTFTLCFENNKVYYEDNNAIYLLYDFNANENDTWVSRIKDYNNPDDELRTIAVDSVSEMIISSDTLKVLYTSASFSPYAGYVNAYFTNPIIEKIGADYLFLEDRTFKLSIYLRCYNDDSITYSTVNFPCDTIFPPIPYSISPVVDLNNDLIIYPNPADNEITIKLQPERYNTELKILIYDLKGVCYYNIIEKNIKDEYKINTSSLVNGSYILKIISNDNIIQKKFTIVR